MRIILAMMLFTMCGGIYADTKTDEAALFAERYLTSLINRDWSDMASFYSSDEVHDLRERYVNGISECGNERLTRSFRNAFMGSRDLKEVTALSDKEFFEVFLYHQFNAHKSVEFDILVAAKGKDGAYYVVYVFGNEPLQQADLKYNVLRIYLDKASEKYFLSTKSLYLINRVIDRLKRCA